MGWETLYTLSYPSLTLLPSSFPKVLVIISQDLKVRIATRPIVSFVWSVYIDELYHPEWWMYWFENQFRNYITFNKRWCRDTVELKGNLESFWRKNYHGLDIAAKRLEASTEILRCVWGGGGSNHSYKCSLDLWETLL